VNFFLGTGPEKRIAFLLSPLSLLPGFSPLHAAGVLYIGSVFASQGREFVVVGRGAEPWTLEMASFSEEKRAAPQRDEVLYFHSSRSPCCMIHVCCSPPEKKIQEPRPELFHFLARNMLPTIRL